MYKDAINKHLESKELELERIKLNILEDQQIVDTATSEISIMAARIRIIKTIYDSEFYEKQGYVDALKECVKRIDDNNIREFINNKVSDVPKYFNYEVVAFLIEALSNTLNLYKCNDTGTAKANLYMAFNLIYNSPIDTSPLIIEGKQEAYQYVLNMLPNEHQFDIDIAIRDNGNCSNQKVKCIHCQMRSILKTNPEELCSYKRVYEKALIIKAMINK